MKKRLILLLAAAMLCAMSGCGGTEGALTPQTSEPQQSETPSEPRYTVTADNYDETFLAEDGVTQLMHVFYSMPVLTVEGDAEASAKANETLMALKERFLHSEDEYDISVDSALADAKSAREQGYDGPSYAMEQTFTVPRADSAVVSILNNYYSDLGGTHPNTVFSAVCFGLDGNRVSLSDLSGDAEGFKRFCAEKVLALAERDEGDGRYYENYRELIADNIRDDLWYFSEDGLTFLYNTYDIGTHAAGMFEFTVPYSELSGVMDDRWLPVNGAADGSVTCDFAENADAAEPVFVLEADESGSEYVFTARGTVRGVQVAAASNDGEQYVENGLLAFVSRLDDGERFSIKYVFPGDMSCLSLRYVTAGGETVVKYITLSGEDGSVLMLEPAQ